MSEVKKAFEPALAKKVEISKIFILWEDQDGKEA